MLKKELKERVEELEFELNKVKVSNSQMDDDIEDLEEDVNELERENRNNELNNAYIRGQIEVLKRVSGLYPEERLSREEYKELLEILQF